MKEYSLNNIDDCFRFFFEEIDFFSSPLKKDFYIKDFPIIKKFLFSQEKEIFPFPIFDENSNTIVYNFYNIFVIKFTSYERVKSQENKIKESFLENKMCFQTLLKLEKQISINNSINKFDCILLQPFILSLRKLDEIMQENEKYLENINKNIILIRSFFDNKVDISPTNIGIYNGKFTLFDL